MMTETMYAIVLTQERMSTPTDPHAHHRHAAAALARAERKTRWRSRRQWWFALLQNHSRTRAAMPAEATDGC